MSEADCATAADTAALGAALAGALAPPCTVALEGPLGAGKTTLVRGFLAALGHGGAVPSPTYNLLLSYRLGGTVVHHLDLYRLSDPEELELLGVRDLVADDAIWLIEWPERGSGFLPPFDHHLRLEPGADGGRRVRGLPAALAGRADS